jgi:hypothetical protein
LLRVDRDPLRILLRTPTDAPGGQAVIVEDNRITVSAAAAQRVRVIAAAPSVSLFWDDVPLVMATRLDDETIHVKLDLRPIGINVFDDADGLHLGENVLADNAIVNCETAIGLA